MGSVLFLGRASLAVDHEDSSYHELKYSLKKDVRKSQKWQVLASASCDRHYKKKINI